MNNQRVLLKPGTVIDFMGQQATVVEDEGITLYVEVDGCLEYWFWSLDGIECTIVSNT